MDLITRYEHGEFFNEDSIKQTGEVYHTKLGRDVYGGGGIMPDYFVAEDTTLFTSYYTEAVSTGLVSQFCFEYVDNNRPTLQKYETPEELLRYIKRQNLIEAFAKYADKHDLRRRNNMIVKSKSLLEHAIYGSIIYNIFEIGDYTEYINRSDQTVLKAVDLYKKEKTRPTVK